MRLKARTPDLLDLQAREGGCALHLRVQPSAKQTALVRRTDGRIVARIQAPATDGKANAALRRLIARVLLGIPQSRVRITKGKRSKEKTVEIDLDLATVQEVLHRYLDA